jgi:hypothetical protein
MGSVLSLSQGVEVPAIVTSSYAVPTTPVPYSATLKRFCGAPLLLLDAAALLEAVALPEEVLDDVLALLAPPAPASPPVPPEPALVVAPPAEPVDPDVALACEVVLDPPAPRVWLPVAHVTPESTQTAPAHVASAADDAERRWAEGLCRSMGSISVRVWRSAYLGMGGMMTWLMGCTFIPPG